MRLISSRRGRIFLGLGIVGIFAAARIFTSGMRPIPLPELRDALSLSTAILIESFPFIMLGVLISIVVRVWMPAWLFAKLTPSHPVARRILMSFLGTLLPVCECGNVPLARALLRQGLSAGDVIAFTLSAPLLNPVTIMTTYQAFGSENGILWGRLVGGFLIAQIVAWAVTWRNAGVRALSPALAAELESCECCTTEHTPQNNNSKNRADHQHNNDNPANNPCGCAGETVAAASHSHEHDSHSHSQKITESLHIFQTETAILLPPLIFGSLIAGIIQIGVSREILLAVGTDPVLSVLALIALAFIVSICSSVDAFFALSLAAAFAPGALTSFLVFGAMVDIKMLMLLRTTFTTRTLGRVVIVVTILCALLGMGVNLSGITA